MACTAAGVNTGSSIINFVLVNKLYSKTGTLLEQETGENKQHETARSPDWKTLHGNNIDSSFTGYP